MTILSVTHESKEEIAAFVDQLEPIYPILCQGRGEIGAYSTGAVPAAYLITPDRKVAWVGNPGGLQDSEIEELLKTVEKEHRVSTWGFLIRKSLPTVPEKLSQVPDLLEKMKFGSALKKVEGVLKRLEGEEREAGEKVRAWIEGVAAKDMEAAAAHVADGKIYKGFLLYEQVEDRFKGHDLAKQAKDAAKALEKDKAHKLEIKASEKLEKIKAEMREERKPEDQLACLKPLLSKKYAETLAGREAAKLAEELEARVQK